jgi:hypothetical protein
MSARARRDSGTANNPKSVRRHGTCPAKNSVQCPNMTQIGIPSVKHILSAIISCRNAIRIAVAPGAICSVDGAICGRLATGTRKLRARKQIRTGSLVRVILFCAIGDLWLLPLDQNSRCAERLNSLSVDAFRAENFGPEKSAPLCLLGSDQMAFVVLARQATMFTHSRSLDVLLPLHVHVKVRKI